MKILKHGSKYIVHSLTQKCGKCGCVFSFSQYDCSSVRVKRVIAASSGERRAAVTVVCPECKRKNKIEYTSL